MNDGSPIHIHHDLLRPGNSSPVGSIGRRSPGRGVIWLPGKGEAHVQSDWDLLLIAENLPEKPLARHFFLKRALPPACRGAVSLVAKTPAEFEARVSPLYLDIALDGMILYDPKGYALARLEKLKNLIATSGLHRLRSKDGDVWKFDKPHFEPWSLSWE